MGIPIVVATNGYGTPITEAANGYGQPVTVATNGYGVPVVIVASGGLPVVGSGGAASAYAPESETIFAAFTTPPTTARKDAIDAAVVALKTAGVWAKLDALYAFAAADSQAAKINWKAPGTYNCTEVNAPAFVADQGFTGASTKRLDSGFNPTTAPSPKLTLNDVSIFAWSTGPNLASQSGSLLSQGTSAGSPELMILPRYSGDGNFYGKICHVADGNILNPFSELSAFWTGVRTSASATVYYHNGGASFLSGVPAAAALPSNTIWFLNRSVVADQFFPGTIAAGGFGSQLSQTENTALYNALNGYLATIKIVSAFTTPPTQARQALIQNCVTSLMTAGVWDKLDALYAFAAADAQAAKINWKAPGTYNCTEVNAPTFTADQGFTGAATKYLDSGFNPTTAPTPKFVTASACLFGWCLTVGSSGDAMIGTVGADTINAILPNSGGTNYVFVNGANFTGSATADGSGLSMGMRRGGSQDIYKNGAFVTTAAIGNSAPASSNLAFLKRQSAVWTGQMAGGGFGVELTAGENTALYNALRAYMTGVGVP